MRKSGKRSYHVLYLILALVGLMIGAILAPEPAERVSAQVVGPNWSVTGSLNKARVGHTATLLRNGKVLVAGGIETLLQAVPPRKSTILPPGSGLRPEVSTPLGWGT